MIEAFRHWLHARFERILELPPWDGPVERALDRALPVEGGPIGFMPAPDAHGWLLLRDLTRLQAATEWAIGVLEAHEEQALPVADRLAMAQRLRRSLRGDTA